MAQSICNRDNVGTGQLLLLNLIHNTAYSIIPHVRRNMLCCCQEYSRTLHPTPSHITHTQTLTSHKYLLQVLSYPCLVIVRILGLPFVKVTVPSSIPILSFMIEQNMLTQEFWAYPMLRNSYIIIFQLPLCSYSGVQNIVTVNV